jgi:signal transduction histidine kinase
MTKFMAFRRRGKWLVYDLNGDGVLSPIPEKVVSRQWLDGDDGTPFPTLTAVKAFLQLRYS